MHSNTVASFRRFLKETASGQHHVPIIPTRYSSQYQTQMTAIPTYAHPYLSLPIHSALLLITIHIHIPIPLTLLIQALSRCP